MAKKKTSSRATTAYNVHPVVAYAQAVIRNLPENTGKSLPQWLTLVKKQTLDDEKQIRQWLKQHRKLGGTTAMLIAQQAVGKGQENTSEKAYLKMAAEYVDRLYSGAKSGLKPIHDAVIKIGRDLGKDVRVCPCRTIVPLYREHVFAEIKPSTRTRIDLGLALKATSKRIPKRIIDTGGLSKGDRITHRIPLSDVNEVDDFVQRWLEIAYDLDA